MQILALDMMKIPAGVAQSVERQFCKRIFGVFQAIYGWLLL
jgi:hypothetical protein